MWRAATFPNMANERTLCPLSETYSMSYRPQTPCHLKNQDIRRGRNVIFRKSKFFFISIFLKALEFIERHKRRQAIQRKYREQRFTFVIELSQNKNEILVYISGGYSQKFRVDLADFIVSFARPSESGHPEHRTPKKRTGYIPRFYYSFVFSICSYFMEKIANFG
jgi:hypothetical protein